jgi:hypothetical protein
MTSQPNNIFCVLYTEDDDYEPDPTETESAKAEYIRSNTVHNERVFDAYMHYYA